MARVLITDDAAFMRMMIKNILTQNGHEVVGEAANGAAGRRAVHRAQARRLHDGHHDAREGRHRGPQGASSRPTRRARVVMCSALGQEAKVIESIRSGAKDFVVKPFQQDRVLAAIEKALA